MTAAPLLDHSPTRLGYVVGMTCLCGCGRSYTLEELRTEAGTICVNGTPDCLNGGPLDIRYDLDTLRSVLTPAVVRRRYLQGPAFWLMRELLPVDREGIDPDRPFTPLVKSQVIGPALGIDLYFKLDNCNPTGSFKDRPATLAFQRATEDGGYQTAYIASTGNLAISTGYLAARTGLGCRIFVPRSTGAARAALIRRYLSDDMPDARPDPRRVRTLEECDGNYDRVNTRSILAAGEENDKAVRREGHQIVFIPNDSFRVFYREGAKTSGTETALQLHHAFNTDPGREVKLFYPAGSGALACSAMKGIGELQALGLFLNPVSLWINQPSTCAPIVDAMQAMWPQLAEHTYAELRDRVMIHPVNVHAHTTIAESIAIGDPGSGYETLDLTVGRNGGGFAVSEAEVVRHTIELYKKENILAEPVAGVTLGGVYQAVAEDRIAADDVVVVHIAATGWGRLEEAFLRMACERGLDEQTARLLRNVTPGMFAGI